MKSVKADIKRIAWLRRQVSHQLVAEAERKFPSETGGVLMGYWVKPSIEVVVTHAIGPGPKAVHYGKSFIPDGEYQEAEIGRIYAESDRISTYLGDWHSHPRGSTCLSYRDKQTLHKIAGYREARCITPVMALVAGGEGDWRIRIWKYQPRKGLSRLFGISVVALQPLKYSD